MMKDIQVKVSKKTRFVDLDTSTIGNDSENLQERFVFSFTDEFVNGQARLETTIGGESSYIELTKEGEAYYCPVKSAMTKKGKIDMQLVITEGTNEEEIPIFKSNIFYVYCNASINAEIEQPEEYPEWIDIANTKLNQMDNFDIDASKSGNTATVTITKRDGTEQSVEITDGETGPQGPEGPAGQDGKDGVDGKDAKINGVNTLNVVAGDNITIEQEDNTMTISSTGGGGGSTYTAGTGIEITAGNVINNTSPDKTITLEVDQSTMQFNKTADEVNDYLTNGYIVMALGYQVFRRDYDASTHTIRLAIFFGSFGQIITVVGNQLTGVSEYFYVSDEHYVHTDNNFTSSYKDKLDSIPDVVDLSSYQVGDTISDTALVSQLMNDSCKIKYGGTIYSFATTIGTGYIYTVMNSLTAGAYITLNYDSGSNTFYFYEAGTAPWESPSNKVQNLNTPTTETYPSTLAVYNALQGVGGDSFYLGNVTDYTNNNRLDISKLDVGLYCFSTTSLSNSIPVQGTNNGVSFTGTISTTLDTAYSPYILYLQITQKISDIELTSSIQYFGTLYIDGIYEYDKILRYKQQSLGISKNGSTITINSSSATSTDFQLVTRNGSQTISGKKTFSTLPESSVTPTTNNQLVNKSYVDNAISTAITTTLGGSY